MASPEPWPARISLVAAVCSFASGMRAMRSATDALIFSAHRAFFATSGRPTSFSRAWM